VTEPLTAANLTDLAQLFSASKVCSGCWCMTPRRMVMRRVL
jgi:hypothetical protein